MINFCFFILTVFSFILKLYSIKSNNISGINYLNLRKLNFFTSSKSNKKNLVIGSIINYSWSKIELYFISLIKAGFHDCDFVLFVGGISNETVKKIESCGVITYKISKKIFRLKTTINNFRWKLYEDFLKENKNKYNMVFTADVRDTIFQKDIFQYYDSSKSFLGVFLEDGSMRSKANRIWVQKFCNESEYKKIENEAVICSGTLIGTVDKFLEFSHDLWDILKDKKRVVDQGGANYLIYCKKLFNDCLIIKDNHYFVMTIGMTDIKNVFSDKDDNILNFDGQIAAVVHQYDRKHNIVDKLRIKFNDSFIFTKNNNKEKDNVIKIEKKAKYIFLFIVQISVIMICFFCYIARKKRKKSQKIFKKVKLKVYKKKIKTKKFKLISNYSMIPQE